MAESAIDLGYMSFQIRVANPDDFDGIAQVVTDAFGDESVAINKLVTDLRNHWSGREGFELVAEVAGTVVGHVFVSSNILDAPHALVRVAVLGPLGVSSKYQRQGIGGALIAAAATRADTAGFGVLFVEGDPGYYSLHGFVPGEPLGFRRPSLRTPAPAFQVKTLSGYSDALSGTLVYAEPFWLNDCVGLR